MLQRESPLIHVCSLRIARTFLARSRTTLKTRTRSLPLHVGGGGRASTSLDNYGPLSVSFLKRERERRRRPLGQISAWFTTIPGQGTFFIPHTLYVVRVTTAPCLELLSVQSATISHRPLPRDVISCCIVSELNNSRYFERGGGGGSKGFVFRSEAFWERRFLRAKSYCGWLLSRMNEIIL